MRKPLLRLAPVVALVLLAPLLTLPSALATSPEEQLEEVQDRIQRQERAIEQANSREENLLDEIARADQRRHEQLGKLELIQGQLADARLRLEDLQKELKRKERRLDYLELRATITQAILNGQIERLEDRVAEAYKNGPAGYLGLVLGSDSIDQLISRQEFVDEALEADADILDEIENSKAKVDSQKSLVEAERNEVEAQRNRVRAEVTRISGLESQQQFVVDQIEQALADRKAALDDVRDARADARKALRELKAQEERIRDIIENQGSHGPGNYNGGRFYWPTAGGIGSDYGMRYHPILHYWRLHAGVDIGGACSQPIWAAEDGVVLFAGYNGGYGYETLIDHGGGLATLYAHQSSLQVSTGEVVTRGEQIGLVGTTGLSTSCHLHFEVRVNGNPVDPKPYLYG